MRVLSNPNSLFIVIWSLALFLYSLNCLSIYVPLKLDVFFLISLNMLVSVILLLVNTITQKETYDKERSNLELNFFLRRNEVRIKKFINNLLLIYILILIADIYYSDGVPFIWALTKSDKSYIDFGIPTLHGLSNSIIFFLASFLAILIFFKVGNYKKILVCLFIYQIMLLSRGTIIVMTVQILGVVLVVNKSTVFKKLCIALFFVFFIIGFGMLGDLRQGANPYYGLIVDEWKPVFENLPSGVLWWFVYFTSGVNNLNFNVGVLEPLYLPIYTFSKLVPSVVLNMLEMEKVADNFQFVNSGLNISTIYSAFYSDFGLYSFLMVMFIQIVASKKYNSARKGQVYSLLGYLVVYQALFLSFFIDTFFYIPFLFQFVIIYLLKVTLNETKS